MNLYKYSEKSIAVCGNTKPYREKLKELGGLFNSHLNINGSPTPGWIFPISSYDKVSSFIENPSLETKEVNNDILLDEDTFNAIRKKQRREICVICNNYFNNLVPGQQLFFAFDDLLIKKVILAVYKCKDIDRIKAMYGSELLIPIQDDNISDLYIVFEF